MSRPTDHQRLEEAAELLYDFDHNPRKTWQALDERDREFWRQIAERQRDFWTRTDDGGKA